MTHGTHGPQADEIRKVEQMTDKVDISPEEVELLPRPDCASTWTLDPQFVMDVANTIQREDGWDTTMEVVELAMLAAEKSILETAAIRTLAAERDALQAKLDASADLSDALVRAALEAAARNARKVGAQHEPFGHPAIGEDAVRLDCACEITASIHALADDPEAVAAIVAQVMEGK